MPQLLRRFRPAAPAARRPRLGFDVLESRDCPSAWDVPLPSGYDPEQGGFVALGGPLPPDGPTNAPPRIEDFDATSIGNGMYAFTGTVIDEVTLGMYVTFSGVPTIDGRTCTAGPGGMFSFNIQLRTDGTDTGIVSVVTYDNIGQKSNEPWVEVNPIG